MPLRKLHYASIGRLIRRFLSTVEEDSAVALIGQLRAARKRGHITKSELQAICRWKSSRAMKHIRANSRAQVRRATTAALATRSERARLEGLRTLRGVSVPMASAVLTLLYPRRYGVIDIRVWQLLHRFGAVNNKPHGVGFNFNNWYQFLMIIRHFARRHQVKARDIERTLFQTHKRYQTGRLYDS